MVQTPGERQKRKRKTVMAFRGHHTTMSGRQKKKGKTSNWKVWVGEVETEWDEPISQEAKQWFSQRLEEKLLQDHGGRLTQKAAVSLTIKDRQMQRYVNANGLQMSASDVAWAWVAQQVRVGKAVPGERVFRPEIGRLAHSEEQILWQLVAQATTGWDVTVRQKISRVTLARVVLSRQVLKSTYRVSEREIAERLGLTTGEVWDMELGAVEMTPKLAMLVWQNTNKLAGLAEGGGAGRQGGRGSGHACTCS